MNICYFRSNLRVHDNLPLYHAIQSAIKTHSALVPVICVDPRMLDISILNNELGANYVPPKTRYHDLDRCAAFRTRFMIESIVSLKQQLKKRQNDLLILFGKPEEVLPQFAAFLKRLPLNEIHTDKEYAHEELELEKALSPLRMKYHHDSFMIHPSDVNFTFEQTSKVFTHFRKRIEKMDSPVRPLVAIPDTLPAFPADAWTFPHAQEGDRLLKVLYDKAEHEMEPRSVCAWEGGEEVGKQRLNDYLFGTKAVSTYKVTRNGMVGTEYSTKFSAFLSNGCLSPRLIWHELSRYNELHPCKSGDDQDGVYWVKFELLWRDYFRYLVAGNGKKIFLLHGFRPKKDPTLQIENKKSYYNKVWKTDEDLFLKWRLGQTGVPFIDASMRELLLTGFLNNRGRQNVASYLAKDLELDWRAGAEWFESILKDHDVYSNYGNWQYVSGVGCDPREGMRHFNIIKQSKDYDPNGDYVRLWCPELKDIPTNYIQTPWLLTQDEQKKYKCKIGVDYPEPILKVETWKRYYPSQNKRITDYLTKSKKLKTVSH